MVSQERKAAQEDQAKTLLPLTFYCQFHQYANARRFRAHLGRRVPLASLVHQETQPNPEWTARRAALDPVGHRAHLAPMETQARLVRLDHRVKLAPAQKHHPAHLVQEVPKARLVNQANLAHLERMPPAQEPLALLAILALQATRASLGHLVPPATQARVEALACAPTAHLLVWLQVIKRH
jgi:hypothetical protein